jgi:hypothetical protein
MVLYGGQLVAMAKTHAPIVDPTLPTATVTLDNAKEYTLCLNHRALAEAERAFLAEGTHVNLLWAFIELNLSSLMVLFPCALRKFHPEISFKDAQDLLTPYNAMQAMQAVSVLWADSHVEAPKGKNE